MANEEWISAEVLTKRGWIKRGNAWYFPRSTKGLTNYDGRWQLWKNGKSFDVVKMNDL